MTVDMTKWQDMARANAHIRPAGSGRMAGKICIVTGAAQGFGKGIAEEIYRMPNSFGGYQQIDTATFFA